MKFTTLAILTLALSAQSLANQQNNSFRNLQSSSSKHSLEARNKHKQHNSFRNLQSLDYEKQGDTFTSVGVGLGISDDGYTIAMCDGLDVVNIYSWDNGSGAWTPLGNPIENVASTPGDNGFGEEDIAFADGNKIVAIGAPGEDKVYVFQFDDSSNDWVPYGDPIEPNDSNASYGKRLTMSSDGTRLAVGDATRETSGVKTGKIYVYTYESSSGWTLAASMEGPDSVPNNFGFSVSFDDAGETLAVGAYTRDTNTGFCQVLNFDGSNLTEKGGRIARNLDGSDSSLDTHLRNGYSVSISADGNIVAVSARNRAAGPGHVHVNEWDGSAWVMKGSVITENNNGDYFGETISLSGDGLVLIIGAENIDPGKAQIYEFDGTNYVQKGSDLVNFELGNTKCGSTVKISSDGHTVIYACTEGTGEATVYDNHPPTVAPTAFPSPSPSDMLVDDNSNTSNDSTDGTDGTDDTSNSTSIDEEECCCESGDGTIDILLGISITGLFKFIVEKFN